MCKHTFFLGKASKERGILKGLRPFDPTYKNDFQPFKIGGNHHVF